MEGGVVFFFMLLKCNSSDNLILSDGNCQTLGTLMGLAYCGEKNKDSCLLIYAYAFMVLLIVFVQLHHICSKFMF